MASSPSDIPVRRNRPGCMSGLTHLFDFNQALAGRRLLTDRKYGAGLETPGSIVSREMEHLLAATSKRPEEFGRSASISGRSADISMKALIAEEISNEVVRGTEAKGRTPNVVARLMGLDALPSGRGIVQGIQYDEYDYSSQKAPSEVLYYGKALGHSSSCEHKSGVPSRSSSDISYSRRSSWDDQISNCRPTPSQKDLNKEKSQRILDPWKDWKSEEHARMQALDDLDTQLSAKRMLIEQKLTEAKLGLLSKHTSSNEKLYESKEFMDAIDFLQSNKDFFARFLEEPDSLFAKHLQTNSKRHAVKSQELKNCTKRYSATESNNHSTAQKWPKDPYNSDKYLNKTSGRSILANAKPVMQRPSRQDISVCQEKYTIDNGPTNRNGISQQTPTKIVVLKPVPGKTQSLMSSSQKSPRSPRNFSDALEAIKENSADVLLDLKHKLQQDDSRRPTLKNWASVYEQSVPLRDPREIAREIARQVRETVTKDIRASMGKVAVNESPIDRRRDKNIVAKDEIIGSQRGINFVFGKEQAKTGQSDMSNQGFDKKKSSLQEESRRLPSSPIVQGADVHARHPVSLRRSHHHRNLDYNPHKRKTLAVDSTNKIHANQISSTVETDMDSDSDSGSHSLCESEVNLHSRNKVAARITLLRSRSVPTSRSSLCGAEEGEQGIGRCNLLFPSEEKAMDCEKSFNAAIDQLMPPKYSSSKWNCLGVEQDLSKSKIHVKQPNENAVICQESPTEKSQQNACSESEKAQHQIDDTGPIADSDSSVSSLDNVLTLETSLLSGETARPKLFDELTSPASRQTKPQNTKFPASEDTTSQPMRLDQKSQDQAVSLSESLIVELTAADDQKKIKDPLEHPSPVSVLDAHFHEESASPVYFTQLSSSLQDLQVRIQLLKFDDQEPVSIQEEDQEDDRGLKNDGISTNNHSYSSDVDCFPQHVEDAGFVLEGSVSFQETEPELTYVKDLLVASGLSLESSSTLMKWHKPKQPLDSCIFEIVENSYRSNESISAMRKNGGLIRQRRLLLFDIVNEVLVDVLDPLMSCHTCWNSIHKPSTLYHRADFLGQIWSRVSKLLWSQSDGQDTLGSLVAEDLACKDPWQELSPDNELVLLVAEEAIWNDLLEDVVCVFLGT
ncbi:hypothetical protein KP509_38G022100 [Ceratopteris richardii]|uniref:DUF4378 domain-containing protein n=1 Tax=Ceratopteris richardii TaxID=49495 RepID=A0A8T2Q2F6_CERRI|nr:hypothetical protein KP509_38G022100 [Ceratopteris richardii]KAH7278062.1 hypothetical protein KP509_38G022100 [Ceratopteris richardii]